MMQGIRQGNVDGVNAGIVRQRLDVSVDALNAETLRERAPLVERAAQAGGEPRARALDHGRCDEVGCGPAGPHDTPAYRGLSTTHRHASLSLSWSLRSLPPAWWPYRRCHRRSGRSGSTRRTRTGGTVPGFPGPGWWPEGRAP